MTGGVHVDQSRKSDSAGRVVAAKLRFIRHAILYVFAVVGLFAANRALGSGYEWWPWVSFVWGLGLVTHFVSAFVRTPLMQREMDRVDE
jgi:hypothetical protein